MTTIKEWNGAAWQTIIVGETGPQGVQGVAGPTGATGPSGANGATGPAGPGVKVMGTLAGTSTPLPTATSQGEMWIIGSPIPSVVPDPIGGTKAVGDGIVFQGIVWNNIGPFRGPPGADGTDGATGPAGTTGATGPGVAAGGTTGQVLTKTSGTDYATNWQTPASGGVASSRLISTTAPLTGGGDLSADRTLAISDFTVSSAGAVPTPGGTSTGRFLMDDGTWSAPSASISGIGGVFPFTYNTSTAEPPIGNQIRGNNSTFASSTKLWIMETTTDGLDVTVGLGRIKAGFQIYIQNYNNSAQYAIWNVTADSVDKGAYWEVTVTPASSAGTIPGGKIALQSLSAAQASNLFSTTTTAPGLTPGSNGGGAGTWLSGAGTWTTPTKTTVGLGNVDNTSDATKDAATSTLTNKTLTDPKVHLAINAQTGTTYTLVLTDDGKLITCSNAAAVTLTVPPNSSVAFPTGTQITIVGIGVGIVTVAQGSGVTVNATPSLAFRARYSAATLVKTGTDQWYLMGDLA